MTHERMALSELLERGSDAELLREMIGYVAQRRPPQSPGSALPASMLTEVPLC